MPPTPPPKQLKNMNLRDIAKLDLKDLQKVDYQGFLKDVSKKPDKIIIILAPLLAIFVGFKTFTNTQTERRTRSSSTVLMESKIVLVDEYKKSQEDLNSFLATMPKQITESEFVNKITDFAVKRGVQIESFSPAKNQRDPLFDLITINININSKKYENIWLFINDIEKSGLNIRINSWSGSMGPRAQQQQTVFRRPQQNFIDSIENSVINVRLEIAAISFKNEQP